MKWNPYKALSWLALCSSFLFFSANSFAVDIYWYPQNDPSAHSGSKESACDAAAALYQSVRPGQTYNITSCNLDGPNRAKAIGCKTAPSSQCGIFYSYVYMVGATCEPPKFLAPDGLSCIDDPCKDHSGEVSNPSFGNYYFATSGSDMGAAPVGCFNGCKHRVLNGFQGPMPFGGGFMLVASALSNIGESCDSGTLTVTVIPASDIPSVPPEDDPDNDGEPDDPSDCPPGTGFAQINNRSTCLPSGTTGAGSSSSSSTAPTNTTTTDPVTGETTTTSSGGSPVTTSTNSKWTINGDGTVTVTTTKTVDYGNGKTDTSTTTSTGSVAGLTSGSGGSGSSGSGSGSGVGGGGDVDLGPAPSWNDPGNGGDAPDLTIGQLDAIDIHQVFLPEGGECALQDIPLEVMGISVSIPLSSACPYFPYVYGLVVFMSSLVSIRLFAMAPW